MQIFPVREVKLADEFLDPLETESLRTWTIGNIILFHVYQLKLVSDTLTEKVYIKVITTE